MKGGEKWESLVLLNHTVRGVQRKIQGALRYRANRRHYHASGTYQGKSIMWSPEIHRGSIKFRDIGSDPENEVMIFTDRQVLDRDMAKSGVDTDLMRQERQWGLQRQYIDGTKIVGT